MKWLLENCGGRKSSLTLIKGIRAGITVLVKDNTPITDIGFENIIKGNFSQLSFQIKDERVLLSAS